MSPNLEISIPSTSTSTSGSSKPYTVYNITLRLPLRTLTLQKRYSDFTTLHASITTQAGGLLPPAPLPQKSWFTRSTSSPALTEERRKGLEAYLNAINNSPDGRWRDTSAWRTFLNLPSSNSSKSSLASTLHGAINNPGSMAPITDPVAWLDHHRELKAQLHDARLNLTRRDQASTAQAQHEASVQAKKCLVRAGTMISALETGLQNLGSSSSIRGGASLGEGELRRRKDLLSSAKREREGLENLLSAMAAKSAVDAAVAGASDTSTLLSSNTNGTTATSISSHNGGSPGGRVLSRETGKTRALDNQGVLQLQKQMMQEQDEDVDVLAAAVRRQKELGIQIQEELEVQKDLLGMLDEDVTRVQGKMDVARKRVNKIS
ncbi:hypothetical protein N7G274_004086 [Stereocaulon virgatum]|uniref:Syntaxin n=1 Tax=Stereocaulon virgatum TaxID=373712 RepID=A0ABR4AAY3_9LECA